MGESKFIDGTVTSVEDAKTLKSGFPAMVDTAEAGYLAAVQSLASATKAGNLEAVAKAKGSIGEYAGQLEALGQEIAEVNAFEASQAPAPVEPVEGGLEG
jgi:hypothetical protein